MKNLLWLIVLIGLSGMYSCTKEFSPSEERNVQQPNPDQFTGDDIVSGQLIIKLVQEPAEVKIVQTRSGELQVETGVKTIDDICAAIGASNMRRVFRPSGKFEARSRETGLHLWYVVDFPEETSLTRAAFDFNNSEDIDLVEPVYLIEPPVEDIREVNTLLLNEQTRSTIMPFNDSLLNQQWHYEYMANFEFYSRHINLFGAWSKTIGHPDIIVAVVDGGIQYNHPDLMENMWVNEGEIPGNGIDDDGNGFVDDYYGYNFYHNSSSIQPGNHGTHVAGIIGAVNNNRIGISGVAGGDKALNKKGVRLMNCQVLHPETGYGISDYNLAEAIKYGADNGAVISQNSWGYRSPNIFPAVVKAAIDYFIANAGINQYGQQTGPMKGGVVIAAAGNDGTETMHYPAAYSPVVAVTALGPTGAKADYSNYGTWTDIAAPGGDLNITNGGVLSTITGNRYGRMEGTSMACPHVSGVAALILSAALDNQRISMTPTLLKEVMLNTSNFGDLYGIGNNFYLYENKLGKGIINAQVAIGNILPATIEPTITGPDSLPEGEWGTFKLNWGDFTPKGGYTYKWNGMYFVDIEPSEDNWRISARGFDEESYGEVCLTIEGKYNGYFRQIYKQFDVTKKEGDISRLKVTVIRGGGINLNFTLHNANIYNKLLFSGDDNGEFGALLTPGQYRFMIDCLSTPGQSLPFDKIYVDTYMTTHGAHLTVEVEPLGIRVIHLQNNSPNHPNIYRWFYEE